MIIFLNQLFLWGIVWKVISLTHVSKNDKLEFTFLRCKDMDKTRVISSKMSSSWDNFSCFRRLAQKFPEGLVSQSPTHDSLALHFHQKTRAAGGHLAVLFLCGTPPLAELKGRGEETEDSQQWGWHPRKHWLGYRPWRREFWALKRWLSFKMGSIMLQRPFLSRAIYYVLGSVYERISILELLECHGLESLVSMDL